LCPISMIDIQYMWYVDGAIMQHQGWGEGRCSNLGLLIPLDDGDWTCKHWLETGWKC